MLVLPIVPSTPTQQPKPNVAESCTMESSPTFGSECPELWARLRDRCWLWHSTSIGALDRILSDGAIHPNSGQLRDTFPEFKDSYARHLGAISLFDFATENETSIFEHEWKWRSVLFGGGRRLAALIRLKSCALDATKLLLSSDLIEGRDPRFDVLPDDIRRRRMWIPAVEAIHIGPIEVSAVDGFLLVGRGDLDVLRWHEPRGLPNPVPEFLEVSARWEADRKRNIAERRARGEYSGLTELVEAAKRARSKREDGSSDDIPR